MSSRLLAIAFLAAAPCAQERDFQLHAPTPELFAAWRDHILPSASDRAWTTIPWHDSFAAGLRAASSTGKPLLLYAMNGHPLGCT